MTNYIEPIQGTLIYRNNQYFLQIDETQCLKLLRFDADKLTASDIGKRFQGTPFFYKEEAKRALKLDGTIYPATLKRAEE